MPGFRFRFLYLGYKKENDVYHLPFLINRYNDNAMHRNKGIKHDHTDSISLLFSKIHCMLTYTCSSRNILHFV